MLDQTELQEKLYHIPIACAWRAKMTLIALPYKQMSVYQQKAVMNIVCQ